MTSPGLAHIVVALQQRLDDVWDDSIWSESVVYWRNGSDFEMAIKGAERSERMRRELSTLRQAMPDFQIESVFHVDEAAGVVVEVTTWSGHTRDIPGSAVDGDHYRYSTCTVMHVVGGRITRIEVYDDAATARQWNELMTHTRLLAAVESP